MRVGSSEFRFGKRAPASRLLSYALLFLFIYSSTVEAVHHHGVVAGNPQSAASSLITESCAVSDQGNPSAPQGSRAASECLICQFQQNLSNAEIFTPQLELAPPTPHQTVPVAAAIFRSATTSTEQGRGPPSIS